MFANKKIEQLERQVKNLEARVVYLDTKEEGQHLAYRLSRAFGLSSEDVEFSAYTFFPAESIIDIGIGRLGPTLAPRNLVTVYKEKRVFFSGTMEEATLKLNELLAKKHEDCLTLTEKEEKSILDKRRSGYNDCWVRVKPRKSSKTSKLGKGVSK